MINFKGKVIWLWGLSGSGKTTIADLLEKEIKSLNVPVQRLDGDLVREGLTKDLGFSVKDRFEHIRRVSWVADLLASNGICVICSFITPLRAMRIFLRRYFENHLELIFVDCDLEECIKRDVKGLYDKALSGKIDEFTGITSPFELPNSYGEFLPDFDMCINSQNGTPEESVEAIMEMWGEKEE